MTTITALPTPPTRQDPINFADRADEFLAALPTFATETNAVASEINDKYLAVINADIIAENLRGQWVTATAYALKDVYTDNGIAYIVVVSHTSTSIANDAANGKVKVWQGVLFSDLSASSGASLVGFDYTLNYAYSTIGAALKGEAVNVKLFPWLAKGDGVTDDTAAILAAAAANPYAPLYFPAGTYITDPLYVNQSIYGDGPYKSLIKAKAGSTGFLLRAKSLSGQYSVHLRDFQLLANGAGQSGLVVEGATGSVERIRLQNFDTIGLALGNLAQSSGCYWTRTSEIFAVMAGGIGLVVEGGVASANSNILQNVYVSGVFTTGWDVRGFGNTLTGGTAEWTAACTDVIKMSGSGNTLDTPYLEAVAGAVPARLFNLTGNNNDLRNVRLQASLSNSLYSKIVDTGLGNRIDVPLNLRYTSLQEQSKKNYMPNPTFEDWTGANQPYGYTNIGAGAVQDLTTTFNGKPTLKLTVAASALMAQCYLLPNVNSVTNYDLTAVQGKTISLAVACKTAMAGYGGLTYTVLAPSGNINGTSNCSHTGGGGWELFTTALRVPDDATQLIIQLRSHPTGAVGTGDIWFAAPAVVFGRESIPFTDVMPSINEVPFTSSKSFTPVLEGITSAGVGTYSRQFGRYQRIGNRVFFEITLVWTAHTGTGNVKVTGLPYTSINVSAFHSPPCSVYHSNLVVGAGKQLTAFVTANTNTIDLFASDPGGGSVASIAMDGSASLYLSGHYEIA